MDKDTYPDEPEYLSKLANALVSLCEELKVRLLWHNN